MARIGLAFGGAVAGFLLGGPLGAQIGFAIGGILGGVLFPGKLPPGPRVNDLIVTSATDGAPIAFGYGTVRVAGNVIWAPPIVEHSQSKSAKGGPKQTTFSYTASFAVAFGEPGNIGRIWFDSKIVYDPALGTAGITAATETGNVVTITSTLNPGIGTQVTIAGVGVSGYNGKFKVLLSSPVNFTYYNATSGLGPSSGGTATIAPIKYPKPTLYTGAESQQADPTIQAAQGAANTPAFRGLCYAVWANFPLSDFGNRIPNVRAEISYLTSVPPPGVVTVVQDLWNITNAVASSTVSILQTNTAGNALLAFVHTESSLSPTITDTAGNTWVNLQLTQDSNTNFFYGVWYAANCKGGANTVSSTISGSGQSAGHSLRVIELAGADAVNPIDFHGASFNQGNSTVTIGVTTHVPNALVLFECGTMAGGGHSISYTPISPAIALSQHVQNIDQNNANNIESDFAAYYTQATAGAVSIGATLNSTFGNQQVSGISIKPSTSNFLTTTPLLRNIVADICTRCGLALTDIDTSQLVNVPQSSPLVPFPAPGGYVIGRPTTGQNALKPLALAFFFDAVESGGVIKFVPRGGTNAVLTIPEADLGIEKDKFKLSEQIGMAQDLPREFQVLFNDKALDYQQNKQHKRRHTRIVRTKQETVIELPMTIDATTARQIAEKALFLAYLERKPFDMNLWKALYLLFDPTDVIQFTYEGLTFQMRIVKLTIGLGFQVAISGVNEDANNYLSAVVGSDGIGFINATVRTLPDTVLFLLDVPLLRDQDAQPSGSGYYYAMSSISPSTWPGASLQKSSDNVNFAQESTSSVAANYGTASTILPAPGRAYTGSGSPWTWDTTSTLTIFMVNGTLAGTADINVLNGANALLVGNEVIQYANAVQNADGSFTISRLLRGRRGTDKFIGTHGVNESVIDLINPGVVHQPTSLANIQVLRYFRPVTFGADISTIASQLFTNTGSDLSPYAPTSLAGSRDVNSNLTLTWIRRTRIGGDWLEGVGTVPLSEATESYDIEILLNGSVVRTFSAIGGSIITYLASQQLADFGFIPPSITFNVYQNSQTVGRGFKSTATV